VIWTPYCGSAPLPGELLGRWNLDPVLIAALAVGLGLLLYRGAKRPAAIGAFAVLAISFISPLCALSSALFSARTVHHVLLVAVAAPLLAWSLPKVRAGPLALATVIQAAIFWAWHAPGAYSLALSNDAAYWAMQLTFVGSAVWFWMAVRAASAPAAAANLLVAMVAMGLLGALITFAAAPLYAPHLFTTVAWGLTALEDQQAAGLIMWAPAAGFYLVAAVLTIGRMIGPDRSVARAA
jgi:putative membrane protein